MRAAPTVLVTGAAGRLRLALRPSLDAALRRGDLVIHAAAIHPARQAAEPLAAAPQLLAKPKASATERTTK